jgi:hypothetical protein
MAATVQIHEKNGAGGTPTNKTDGEIRYKLADNATVDLNDAILIPSSGFAYSMQKWLRLNVTVAPDTQITNVGVYSDGANGYGTGIDVFAKAEANYATPSIPADVTGYTSLFTYTSASRLSLGAGPYSSTGEIASHLVLVARVASTAASQVTPGEAIHFGWDEI